jgi:hypothetical protein
MFKNAIKLFGIKDSNYINHWKINVSEKWALVL